jgi:hypothetical protein
MSTEPTIPRQPIKPTFFIACVPAEVCAVVLTPYPSKEGRVSLTLQNAAKVASEKNQ